MTDLLLPGILCLALLLGQRRQIPLFPTLCDGAKEGVYTLLRIFPALCILLPILYMFRASGALDALVKLLRPLLERLHIPADCVPLFLLRPLSGSGALAIGSDLFSRFGADSLVGRTAAVMLGSTETTFYVLAVYFGAAGIRRSGHALPAAIVADVTGFLTAALVTRWWFGG